MTEPTLFPFETMPVRLEFGDKKDKTVCYFACSEHLEKYLDRYKLDKRKIKIDYKDGEPAKSGKTNKKKLQQGTTKNSRGSASGSRGSTKKLDTSGTTHRTRKPKSK